MPINTPNMGLGQPIIGVDTGLTWEQTTNANASTIDQHDHSPGKGAPLSPGSLLINADLPFNNNNAITLRSTRFTAQAAPLSLGSDIGCAYVSGVDLWFNDVNGNQIQITSGGSVNATSSGISSGTASASFTAGVLIVNADVNKPANIQGASILLGNNVANSKYLTLSPPNAMAANFGLVLPTIPAVKSIMAIDASGNITGAYTVDNSSIDINGSSQIEVKAAGISSAKLASNINLPGTAVQANSRNIIVQGANTTTNIKMLRGRQALNGSGTPLVGEGWTCSSHPATGQYNITFTTAFASTPVVVATAQQAAYYVTVTSVSTTGFSVFGYSGASQLDTDFEFIAMGPA